MIPGNRYPFTKGGLVLDNMSFTCSNVGANTVTLTATDVNGNVNSAIYSRPHVLENGVLAFIMRERRTYSNQQEVDSAAYLFLENGGGYSGVRLLLKK